MHLQFEVEVLRIEADGSVDIIHDVSNLDCGHLSKPSSCELLGILLRHER